MFGPGLLAKAGTVNDHHMLLANEFFHERLIALWNFDARVRVERSARSNAAYPRRRFAPFLGEVAARPQFALHFQQKILRTLQRRLDGILLGMVRAKACSQQPMNTLGVRLHRGVVAGDDAPSNAPPWNQVVLR